MGGRITVKLAALELVPATLITLIGPDVAPAGTVARSSVSLSTVKLAAVPLNVTALAVLKLVPWTITSAPIGPVAGLNALMVGSGITTKLEALVAVPAGLVTLIAPEVAPAGAVARSRVSLSTVKLAAVPLNVTALALVKLLPWTVTSAPIGPVAGVNALTSGSGITVKLAALLKVPAGLVTLIAPEVAPAGTVARSRVSLSTVKLAAVPPN